MFIFRNIGHDKSSGAEFELQGAWLSGWKGNASYAYVEIRDETSDHVLCSSPRHIAKLGVTAPLVSHRLFAGFDGWFQSKQTTSTGAVLGSVPVFTLTLSAPNFSKHVELSASAYNLFDRSYSLPTSDEIRGAALRQDGRNFRVKLTWRF
jgi:iron complex outermembrane receptor protein